jgi:hypothetical protein
MIVRAPNEFRVTDQICFASQRPVVLLCFYRLWGRTRRGSHSECSAFTFTGQWGKQVESAACLVPCCGGVGGFFVYPSFQIRKCRPAPRSFNFGQTLMPEFQQTPFYIDSSRRQKGPVSDIARLRCGRLHGLLPRCVMKFFRSGGGSGNRSRSCGFRLSGR